MPALEKEIDEWYGQNARVNNHAPVHAAGDRIGRRWEENKDVSEEQEEDWDNVDGETVLSECEICVQQWFLSRSFQGDAGDGH